MAYKVAVRDPRKGLTTMAILVAKCKTVHCTVNLMLRVLGPIALLILTGHATPTAPRTSAAQPAVLNVLVQSAPPSAMAPAFAQGTPTRKEASACATRGGLEIFATLARMDTWARNVNLLGGEHAMTTEIHRLMVHAPATVDMGARNVNCLGRTAMTTEIQRLMAHALATKLGTQVRIANILGNIVALTTEIQHIMANAFATLDT
jgi:hypothetical protein